MPQFLYHSVSKWIEAFSYIMLQLINQSFIPKSMYKFDALIEKKITMKWCFRCMVLSNEICCFFFQIIIRENSFPCDESKEWMRIHMLSYFDSVRFNNCLFFFIESLYRERLLPLWPKPKTRVCVCVFFIIFYSTHTYSILSHMNQCTLDEY